MVKCSFCGYENEDGLLYCDKCKTDLAAPLPVFDASPTPELGTPPAVVISENTPADQEIVQTLQFENIALVEPLEPRTEDVETTPRTLLKEPAPLAGAPSLSIGSAPTVNAAAASSYAPEAKPRLVVIRGEKIDMQYPIYPGKNFLGRTDEKPVDIDLENQEPPDRIWTSRQHAVITLENGLMTIEDLNSLNGTFVNRSRVHPGQARTLQANDIVQVGTVQMKVVIG